MITTQYFIGPPMGLDIPVDAYVVFFSTSAQELIHLNAETWLNSVTFIDQLTKRNPRTMCIGDICHATGTPDCNLKNVFFIRDYDLDPEPKFLYNALELAIDGDCKTVVIQQPLTTRNEQVLMFKMLFMIIEFDKQYPNSTMTVIFNLDENQVDARQALDARKTPCLNKV